MKKWEYTLATALETFIPRADLGKAPEHPAIYFGYADWGYSWVFPNKDRLILGLGALNRKSAKQIKDIFINYINAISHVYSFDASKGMKISGYPVPSGNYLKRPYYKSTLLAGDAAGFADPISGEGIYQAQRSAEIASICIRRALKDGIPIEVGYKELLHRYVFPDLLHARVLRWFVFNAMNKLNFNYINMLTQKGEKRALDIVHGLRTYRFLQLARGIHGDIA
jgi:flavin-dependent dehydrogenase